MGPYLAMDIIFSLSTEVVLVVKNLPANAGDAGDTGSIPGLGRYPGVGNGNPLQYSCWKIPWTEGPDSLQSMGLQKSRIWLACAYKHSIH